MAIASAFNCAAHGVGACWIGQQRLRGLLLGVGAVAVFLSPSMVSREPRQSRACLQPSRPARASTTLGDFDVVVVMAMVLLSFFSELSIITSRETEAAHFFAFSLRSMRDPSKHHWECVDRIPLRPSIRCFRKPLALHTSEALPKLRIITGLSVSAAASMMAWTCSRLLTLKAECRSRSRRRGRATGAWRLIGP